MPEPIDPAGERDPLVQRCHDLVEHTLAAAMFGPIVNLAIMADDLLVRLDAIDEPATAAHS